MINKFNINLKYLIIVVISISALMIAASLIFTFINFRAEKSPSLDAQPAIPIIGIESQKPERAIPLP